LLLPPMMSESPSCNAHTWDGSFFC
jgi:hypothetical protein